MCFLYTSSRRHTSLHGDWSSDFCSSHLNFVATARELDVRMVITLGALLADVPHSRPVAITGLASDQALVEKLRFQRTTYERSEERRVGQAEFTGRESEGR